MPNSIQSREYSRGSGKEGVSRNNLGRERVLVLGEPRVERQCQLGVEPERVECRQPGLLETLFVQKLLCGVFVFFCQPPNILPASD